ncbi:hypothetical protein MKW92_005411 [Papaver armeniacum]|nr:hypothetical protein MKW92_005411 [Papaver armeniacum]
MIQENVMTSQALPYIQQQRQVQGASQRGRGTRGGRGIRGGRGTKGGRGSHMNDPRGTYTPHLGAQAFGSTPTNNTNHVSFSELLESNLNPCDLV